MAGATFGVSQRAAWHCESRPPAAAIQRAVQAKNRGLAPRSNIFFAATGNSQISVYKINTDTRRINMNNKIDVEKWTYSRMIQHETKVGHTLLHTYKQKSSKIAGHAAGGKK